MSLGRNREGLQGGDGPPVSPLAQLAGEGRCIWMRCSSARTKPGGSGHLQQISSLLVPTPKFGLAKAFSQVTSMLLTSLWYRWRRLLWAIYPTESKTCKKEEVTGVHLEMLHTITRSKMPFPGALDCVLKLRVSSKVPGHFVGTKNCLLRAVPPGRCILTPHWSHQVFEPLCPLTKSVHRNQNVFGLCSPLERTEQGFHSPSAADYGGSRRPGCAGETTRCCVRAASSSGGSCPSWRVTCNACAGEG